MNTISLVIPFGTAPKVPAPDEASPGDEGDFYSDADQANADTLVTGIYLVQSAEEAAPLLAAAEVLGFAATYNSGDPHDDESYAVVTISASGRATEA